ncbi:MFS transporter [Zafaria cholistanensis]|uniref:MFS transporter n=1 Tax=Zafaria cholistanensis TaxID=1682741 RepID=A0A5A7NN16_9MICC|nr:MFS transporter [Zafaria cholistanensis]GER22353.1 MFS transporter [Zafaria cholistanensis]
MFAALATPNYRLWVAGTLVSNTGTWMQRVAQDWLVLTVLTDHSGTAAGITMGLQFLPMLLLGPYAGLVADRYHKLRVLRLTQAASGTFALVLGLLVITGTAELWHVYGLALALGMASAFDAPARQSFVSEMVAADLVPNAVALNAASFNTARLLGPGLSGLLIAGLGTGPVFLLNAASFAAVIFALSRMRADQLVPADRTPRGRRQILEGLSYVKGRPDLVLILVLAALVGTFGLNFQITNVLMATTVFGLGPEGYGFLGTVMALGTLGAALMAARRVGPRMPYVIGGAIGFGAFSVLAALMPGYWSYAAVLVLVGMASVTFLNSCNVSIQLGVDPQYRGRVLALYMCVIMGGTPIGAPVVGWLGDAAGARWAVAAGGTVALAAGLGALLVVLRRKKAMRDAEQAAAPARDDGQGPEHPPLEVPDPP